MCGPTNELTPYQSIKKVLAGEIMVVHPAGCFVKNEDGTTIFREFLPNMTARYTPVEGDYWVIYSAGTSEEYHAISPKKAFDEGYAKIEKQV